METTDTGRDAGAVEAMLAHHAALADGVARRVDALGAVVERQDDHGVVAAELVASLAREVLPHAMAKHAGGFSWDDLETGPDLWRVRIAPLAGQAA